MLHILTTLLATALLAFSTGANALKENKEPENNQMFSLRTKPKGAYYDPAEEYPTEVNTAYFYVSEPGTFTYYTTGPGTTSTNVENNSFNIAEFTSGSPPTANYPSISFRGSTQYENSSDAQKLWDIYVDGVFSETYTTEYIPQGVYYVSAQLSQTFTRNNQGSYIWVFDHQEPMTPEDFNEDIFEAVGDTITGLSNALASPWEGILNIFYDTTENEVTQMGYLVLIGLGVSITLLVFWTILRLFKQRD